MQLEYKASLQCEVQKAFNRRVRGERPRRSQRKALTGQGYGAQVSVQRTDANLGHRHQSLEPQSFAATVRNARAFNRRVRGERPWRSQGKALTGQGYGAPVSVQRTDADLGHRHQSLEPQSFAATVRNAKAFNRRVR